MSSIPLPALDIRPQQPNDALGSVEKLMALKSMMGQQQLQQGQVQQQQQAIADQKATTAAWQGWDPKKQTYDDLAKNVVNLGGSANAAMAVTQHGLQVQQAVQTLNKDQLDNFLQRNKAIGDKIEGSLSAPDAQLHDTLTSAVGDLVDAKVLDPQHGQGLAQIIQSTPDPTELRAKADQFAKMQMGAAQVAAQQKTVADTNQANAKAGLDNANAFLAKNKADIINAYKQNPNALLAQVDAIAPPNGPNATLNARTKSQLQFAMSNGDVDGAKAALKQAADQVGGVEKDVQVARATQPLKIETAEAEGKAQQAMRGLAEPVYAMDAQGNKTLTSKTDALQSGAKVILPVSEKQVADDTMLINRLGDVHQKIAQYEQNLQNLGKTVSGKDQSNIAALIGKQSFKVGAFGTELPVDRLNAALDKENISGLSDDAKKLLVSYYNARESMNGYQRVLTGSGRSNETAMQLNLDALPNPGTTNGPYASEAMKQFKQNLAIVGQGLPKIPGIKSPEEIEAQTTTPQNAAPKAPPQGATHIGVGSADKKKYYLDANGRDLGVAE